MSIARALQVFDVFRKGQMVADPTTWKKRQLAINAVFGLLSAAAVLAVNMGWLPQEIATETIQQLAEGIAIAALAILNILATWGTSKKVGVGPAPHMPEPSDAELWDTATIAPRQRPHHAVLDEQGGTDTADAALLGSAESLADRGPPRAERRSRAAVARDVWLGD
jgi:hypothetical protein